MKVDLKTAYEDLQAAKTGETKEAIIRYIACAKRGNFKYGLDTEDWPPYHFTRLMSLGRKAYNAKMQEARDLKVINNQGVDLRDY